MIGVRFNYSGGFAQSAGDSQFPSLHSHLQAYWAPATTGTGNRIITLGMVRRSGVLTNTPGRNFVPSEIGTAMQFDGTNDYLAINGNFEPLLAADPSLTMSAWVKPTNVATPHGVIKLGNELGAAQALSLYIGVLASGQFSFESAGGVGARSAGSIVVANQWNHLLYTKRPGSLTGNGTLYVNGLKVAFSNTQNSSLATTWNNTNTIGRFAAAGDYYAGLIGEVGVWSRQFTPSEVMRLAMGASPLTPNRITKRYFFNFPQSPGTSTGTGIITKFKRDPVPSINASTSRYPSLWRGLCGAWNPSFANPGGKLKDFGPLGMDMTLSGTRIVDCEFGRALSFNGTTDTCITTTGKPLYVSALAPSPLTGDATNNFSISAWLRPASIFQAMGVVKWGGETDGGGTSMASLFLNNLDQGQISMVGLRFVDTLSNAQSINSAINQFTTNQWIHVVITKGAGNINVANICHLYKNGLEIAHTLTLTGSPSYNVDTRDAAGGEPMMLGANGADAPKYPYQGLIGEVLIWNRVLTGMEVMQLYGGASPLQRSAHRVVIGANLPVATISRSRIMVIG